MHRTRAWMMGLAALLIVGTVGSPAEAQRRNRYGFWDNPPNYTQRAHAYLGARGLGMLVVDEVSDYTEGFDFDKTFADGATFEVGGGLDVWLNPYLSVGGQIFYRGIWLEEPNYDPSWPRYDNYVSGTIFDADLSIHF